MAKKITIALVVLMDLCSGASVLQVRPGVPSPAKLWNMAEANVLRLTNKAVHDYEGIRLIYDVARQLRRLQEQERVAKPAPKPGVHDCSMPWPVDPDKVAGKGLPPSRRS